MTYTSAVHHILIADDDPNTRLLLKKILTNEGYTLYFCEDGAEVMSFLAFQDFHLIILDIYMPKVDGLALCQEIRRIKSFDPVPIMIVTGKVDKDTEENVRLAGADALVMKPLSPQKFREQVHDLLLNDRAT